MQNHCKSPRIHLFGSNILNLIVTKPDVFKNFVEAMESEGALTIVDRKIGDEIIGSSRFYDYNPEETSVVIGYTFLSRKHWGGLYNKELKKLMVNYALSFVKRLTFMWESIISGHKRPCLKWEASIQGFKKFVSYAPPKILCL